MNNKIQNILIWRFANYNCLKVDWDKIGGKVLKNLGCLKKHTKEYLSEFYSFNRSNTVAATLGPIITDNIKQMITIS